MTKWGNGRIAHGELGPFEGDPADRVVLEAYARTGTWAPLLLELLCTRLLATGGTLLDAGAHVGLVSIPVALRTGARAIAFEPAPENARFFRRNVTRQGAEARVELHEVALWDRAAEETLALSPDNGGDHRVRPRARSDASASVRVRCATLDDVLGQRELPRPVVLKLDTQGAEARVLRGAQRTLRQVDHVVLEYFPAGLRELGDRPADLDALLAAFPHAAVLSQTELPQELHAREPLLSALSVLMPSERDQGFFDLIVSKQRALTARARETRAQR